MRKQIAAANWKMNLTIQQAGDLLDELIKEKFTLSAGREAVIAVPFPYLALAKEKLKNRGRIFCSCAKLLHTAGGSFYW